MKAILNFIMKSRLKTRKMMRVFIKFAEKKPLKALWKILNQNKQSQKNFTPRLFSKKRKIYSKFSFDLDKFKKA